MKEKKRQRLLQKAINHATKVVKRTTQIGAEPERSDAVMLLSDLVRRKEMG